MQKKTEEFKRALIQFLANMGHKDAPFTVDEDPQDVVDTISIPNWGVYIEVGALVVVKSLLSANRPASDRPGFRVYYMKVHPGGRYSPPEEEDVTICETHHISRALSEAVNHFAKCMADQAVMSLNPDY